MDIKTLIDKFMDGRTSLEEERVLEEYFRKNFDPGILPLFTGELGFTDEELEGEFRFWQDLQPDLLLFRRPRVLCWWPICLA